MKNKEPLLGAHLSIADGFDKVITEAKKIGCTAVQFFSKSNRQWQAKLLEPDQVSRFKKAVINSPIKSIIIHACYLINIGSTDPKISNKSIQALCHELERAAMLGADALVLHPGSHKENTPQGCIDIIANNINKVLDMVPMSQTKLILETMAGQGSSIGHSFEQLFSIYQQIAQKDRIGICLDTCHMFAAGYDIATKTGYENVMQNLDVLFGLHKIGAIHLNDSKKGCGSHVDRHEHIGKGHIGLDVFRQIINDTRLAHVPKILETPLDHPDDHARNIHIIKELIII